MKKYHTVIVDNVFENPQKVINLSKEYEFYPPKLNEEGHGWSGLRTDNLYYLNVDLFRFIVHKAMSFYFSNTSEINFFATAYFHKNIPTKKEKNLTIHKDDVVEIAGVVYLNEGNDIKTGTSIYDDDNNESIIVSNKFNSMICYDANTNHGPSNLDENRLTIPFFIHSINKNNMEYI
jgi:hypothetical protein